MTKETVAAKVARSACGGAGNAALHPAPLSAAELRTSLTRDVRAIIAKHIDAILSRGPINRAYSAWIALFASTVRAICRHISHSEDVAYRADAHRKIPRLAAIVLLQELRVSGELPTIEFAALSTALDIVEQRRGRPGYSLGSAPFGVALGLKFDTVAAGIVFDWEARPPREHAQSTTGHRLPPTDLARAWLILGPRADVNREVEFTEWRNRQREAKRSVSAEEFALECQTNRTSFYEGWIHGGWSDESPQGQRVLAALMLPVAYWPPDTPRRKRDR